MSGSAAASAGGGRPSVRTAPGPAAARHGGGPEPAVDEVPWDDVELSLVHADMAAYSLLHPCECPARCECEA